MHPGVTIRYTSMLDQVDVLVVGGGGREHAICWKLRQSPRLRRLYCAPGNGGTAEIAENAAISPMDFEAIARFAKRQEIDYVVVAPDDPLAYGAG